MEGIIYQKGHKLPKELIFHILKNLGCEDIKSNDYREETENMHSPNKLIVPICDKNLIPDFLCYYKEEETVVEVGNLIDYGSKSKINLFLNKFKYVIHIFSDKKYYLLHCTIYERKEDLDDVHKSFLQNNIKFIGNWLDKLKKQRVNNNE